MNKVLFIIIIIIIIIIITIIFTDITLFTSIIVFIDRSVNDYWIDYLY